MAHFHISTNLAIPEILFHLEQIDPLEFPTNPIRKLAHSHDFRLVRTLRTFYTDIRVPSLLALTISPLLRKFDQSL